MSLPLTTEVYKGKWKTFRLLVPQEASLQDRYQRLLAEGQPMPFPYWGKIWPAAIALAGYLDVNPNLVENKTVIELAGGLGLPALVASQYAKQVTGSDYEPEAVAFIQQNIALNEITNMQATVMNYRQLPHPFLYEVVLLSDINYEPEAFAGLHDMLTTLRKAGVLMVLATPQRLLAKPFVVKLLPFCQQHDFVPVGAEDISVMVI